MQEIETHMFCLSLLYVCKRVACFKSIDCSFQREEKNTTLGYVTLGNLEIKKEKVIQLQEEPCSFMDHMKVVCENNQNTL